MEIQEETCHAGTRRKSTTVKPTQSTDDRLNFKVQFDKELNNA